MLYTERRKKKYNTFQKMLRPIEYSYFGLFSNNIDVANAIMNTLQ
jgi:hypothetical protein